MPNGWYGGWRWESPPYCLQFCIPPHLPLTYITNQPIASLAKVITANIPMWRLAVNIGSTMEGVAKTWLGSTQGTAFCVLTTMQLKLWVVRQQRKPSTSNCDFCYWVNGGNSHRHKQLILRIQTRVQSQYEPRSPSGGTTTVFPIPRSEVLTTPAGQFTCENLPTGLRRSQSVEAVEKNLSAATGTNRNPILRPNNQ
jgi:hypothetical protein